MFAIELTQENLEKIESRLNPSTIDQIGLNVFMGLRAKYYVVSGYYDSYGRTKGVTILPEYILKRSFEIDFDKAKHDWDQIVRK